MQLLQPTRNILISALAVFCALFLVTHLAGLGTDAINPDGVNWHTRSEQFIVGLKAFDFEKTYQHYHPGVTLMWLVGVPVELMKQVLPGFAAYNHETFLTFHTVVKSVLVCAQLVLTLLVLWLLTKTLEVAKAKYPFWIAFLAVSLVSFEPFFMGNARLLHMDTLLALLLFGGLLSAYIYIKELRWYYAILAGVLLGFAFLTKSVAIITLPFILVLCGVYIAKTHSLKMCAKFGALFLIPYLATIFVFFPALWVAPVSTIINIFDEAERVGVRKGHDQVFFEADTSNPGGLFYLFVLLLKLSPVVLIGLFSYGLVLLKKRNQLKTTFSTFSPYLFLGLFYVGYFLVMSFPAKKLDRYMLPIFPFLALLAVAGYFGVADVLSAKARKLYKVVLVLLLVGFIVFPTISLYPYYFTYTSPLFGSAQNANKIIAQKPFGIGIPALRDYILENYTSDPAGKEFPPIGMVDIKPMETIYPNSKVFDIREEGTSKYELIILGPNEGEPEDWFDSDTKFVKDSALYINGLEYWKIYVKDIKN